jgi:hypothetical protein
MRQVKNKKDISKLKSGGGNVTDKETTIDDLRRTVENFVVERDWAQFHSPKNLAMAIGVEAGELMDLFRWRTERTARRA